MKILLIILVITLAVNIISKILFESNFTNDIFGTKRLRHSLSKEIYVSEALYVTSKLLLFIEIIIIAIKMIIIIF